MNKLKKIYMQIWLLRKEFFFFEDSFFDVGGFDPF